MSDPDLDRTPVDASAETLSGERMQALLSYSWDILSLLDAEGHLLYNSPAAQRLHGFTPAEMEGRSTFDFFHPEDSARVSEAFQQSLTQPGRPLRVEYRYARKDGSWIWMEAIAVNLLDQPAIRAIVVNSRDISDRVDTLQALKVSEEFSDRILDALRANITVLDEQGRILKVNQGWRNFASANGLSPETEWEGISYLEICERAAGLGSEDARDTAEGIRAMLAGTLPLFTLEYACPGPEEPRWFQARITRFQGPGSARLVVSHLDITASKVAADERLQLERMIQHAQRMEGLGSLAGGVAHDFNNVLGSILGLASLHEESQPHGSPVQQAFAIISKACRHGATLVRRLLEFARQDLSENRVVDLNHLIQEEVQLLERTTLSQIQFRTELAQDLQAIQGDPSALVHALMNLCLNAVDAMPMGGCLTLRTLNASPGWVEVGIEDTGSGMPGEVLERAMEPFFTTKDAGKGTGLGLSIVYRTVQAHQGTLDIQSTPGAGTRVVLRFPSCGPLQPEGLGRSEAPSAPSEVTLEVLLVDDDELIKATLEAVLQSLGHRVVSTNSGEAALAKLSGGYVPDVVLLDLNMPGLGGHGTLPRLRDHHPALPVFLATGRVDQAALDLAQAYPGVTLLPKPFSRAELRKHLDALTQVPREPQAG